VHFTREPIIETVVTPREGCKITLRNSKGNSQEEYTVEAVEVVSFGTALFFRSQEKPKAFLLPVSDYELIETKETRVILKSISLEKSIKIGGGREATLRIPKEACAEKEEEEAGIREEAAPRAEGADSKLDKRRDRRRRRRRPSDERQETKEWSDKQKEGEPHDIAAPVSASAEGGGAVDETLPPVSSPMLTSLIPPPSTLISETLARYKDAPYAEGAFLSKKVEKPFLAKEEEAQMAPLHMLSPPIEEEKEHAVPHHIFDEEQ